MSETDITVTEGQHSVLGASGAYRWMNCAGSVHMGAQNTEKEVTSPFAAEGIVAHAVGEACLHSGTKEPATFLGDTIHCAGHDITVDQEMVSGVDEYVQLCKGLAAIADVYGVEAQVTLDGAVPEMLKTEGMPSLFGTVDFWAIVNGVLHVIDFKYGKGVVVHVIDNVQLLYYAAAVLSCLTESNRAKVKTVRICVVQPRAPDGDGDTTRWQDVQVLDLLMWLDLELIPAALATMPEDAPLASGGWCRWCHGQVVCPRLRQDALETAKLEFGDTPPDVTALSDEDLDGLMLKSEIMIIFAAAIRGEISQRLDHGRKFEHWKLVDKRANRSWKPTDEDTEHELLLDVTNTLLENNIPDQDAYKPRELKSPTQIEKMLGKKVFREKLGHRVHAPITGTTLVRDTDPRPAAKVGPQDEFDEMT